MKKNIIILVLAVIVVGFGLFSMKKCSNNSAPKTEVVHNMLLLKVEEMGKLEVVKYNIQNIVEHRKIRQWLPNAKTVLVAIGEVTGCIDLAKITKEDIEIKGDSLLIALPEPEICYAKINHSASRVYNIEYGLWESGKLVDEAYQFAERQLLIEARKMGFEEESKKNAIKVLTPLFNALGFNNVKITFKQAYYPLDYSQK